MAAHPGPDPAISALVGRVREQATLRDTLTAALAGRGSLVLIGGEAGIGKTALAEWLLAEADVRGAAVLVGRCYDLSETPPYGPWAEALARAPGGDDLPVPPDLAGGAGAASQAALFAQVRDYLGALTARQPVALLLDDLHWADPASLDLLRSLGRQAADLPVLLLATYRSDELTRRHPLYALLPTLVREAHAERLDLHALDEAALRTLVRACYPLAVADEQRLVAYLAARTEGNAFYLGELLRSLEEHALLRAEGAAWHLGDLAAAPVPSLIRQVLDGRIDRLGDEARELLALAATIGQAVPIALWQAVARRDEAALVPLIERAAEARLLDLQPDGTAARFAHALVREALYEGILPLRRRVWHRLVGEAIAATPAPDPDTAAYHFRQAGDERALEWLVRAGERAQRAYAWLTAAARFEAALELMPATDDTAAARGWLLFHIGRLRRYVDARASIAFMDAAEHLAAGGADRTLAAGVLLERGLFRCFAGEIRRGIAEMEAGVTAYDALPPGDQARLWPLRRDDRRPIEDDGRGTLVLWLAITGRVAEARPLGERLVARAGRQGRAAAPTDAHLGLAIALADLGEPAAAGRAFALARAAYRAIGHHTLVAGSATDELECTLLPYAADRLAERQHLATEAEEAWARARGVHRAGAADTRLARLPLLEVEGRWDEARALGDAQLATAFPGLLARLAHRQGKVERARAVLRDWLPDGPVAEPGDMRFAQAVALQRVAAALALGAGDMPLARAWLAAHDRWHAWSGAVPGRAWGQLGWAAYHRAASDPAAARAAAERALALATDPRQPLALLAAHRCLGELETHAGRHAAAAAHLGAALALADACAAPYERALTLLALAELRATEARRAEATAALDEARTLLAPLGARPALARADTLAARLAAPPPGAPLAAALPFGLTAREAEVLRLVVAGLTNPQVAARLFVTSRTVNAHLTAVYTKLGVEGRAAAIRVALDHGLR